MSQSNKDTARVIEEWVADHPRWPEARQVIETLNQIGWADLTMDCHRSSHLLVALDNDRVVGFLRYILQEIGADQGRPSVEYQGQPLLEAKVLAFGVLPEHRNQGIGRALQEDLLAQAKRKGCYQIRSRSSGDNRANHHLKLSLGFAVHPIATSKDECGVYFVMPLR